MDNFSKYEQMKTDGYSPEDIYQQAKSDKFDFSACIRMLRSVFHFSFVEAKEITLRANNLAISLNEYQETLFDDIQDILDKTEDVE